MSSGRRVAGRMLTAVVLLGIAGGGLIAAAWFQAKREENANFECQGGAPEGSAAIDSRYVDGRMVCTYKGTDGKVLARDTLVDVTVPTEP